MKKYMALLLALCLLTAGCGKGQEAPTTEPPPHKPVEGSRFD